MEIKDIFQKKKEETNINLITCDKINSKNDINTPEENIFLEKTIYYRKL